MRAPQGRPFGPTRHTHTHTPPQDRNLSRLVPSHPPSHAAVPLCGGTSPHLSSGPRDPTPTHTMPAHCVPAPPLLAAAAEVLSDRTFLIQSAASFFFGTLIYTSISGFMAHRFPRKVSAGWGGGRSRSETRRWWRAVCGCSLVMPVWLGELLPACVKGAAPVWVDEAVPVRGDRATAGLDRGGDERTHPPSAPRRWTATSSPCRSRLTLRWLCAPCSLALPSLPPSPWHTRSGAS